MGDEERGYGVGSTLMAFFIGGLVGAGVALLIAPVSGKETRKKIKEVAHEAKEKAEYYMDEVKHKASSAVDKGKEFIEEKKSVFSKAVEAGKEAYQKEKEQVPSE